MDSQKTPDITLLSLHERRDGIKEAKALSAFVGDTQPQHPKWIIDSGACNHMCSQSSMLTNYRKAEEDIVIQSAGGRTGKVEGLGDYTIRIKNEKHETRELKLTAVYHVPNITDNLISASRLIDLNYELRFKGGIAELFTPTGTYTLGTRMDALYTYVADHVEHEKADLCEHSWHVRLGHRNIRDIRTMVKNLNAKGHKITPCSASNICATCVTSKMSNKPFYGNNKPRASRPFQKLHTDLCGPIHPTSLGANKYILTIIDDHSRYAKIYLLKHKDEATHYIKCYIQRGMNKFGLAPLTMRSDGGGEYMGHELEQSFDSLGISHETTLPNTPQQNGVAERYNRTLMNTVRCLLAEGKFPKYLWAEMASTATYLINLNVTGESQTTPYQKWHGRIPVYNHLKSIGTICYYLDTHPQKHKLDPRASPGVLVGYGDSLSFYRIWSPRDQKMYISRCLTFEPEQWPIARNGKATVGSMHTRPPFEDIIEEETTATTEQQEPPKLRKSQRPNQGKTPMVLTYDSQGQQGLTAPDWYVEHPQKYPQNPNELI